MAIAYGFAQAGLFNQRAGGMAAYAEDAYGKDGYFQVFILYFLSLAIGNVAIATSAVGYLATFVPWMSSTPIATCITVIALIWLTTVANFGGPSVTGKIGSVTVWGVLLPVGLLSVIGWFFFKGDVFKEAWNPQGLSTGAGMGSSISLTLWAFLGMESAAQNSSAVENPKRDVPLACMFGTLGAAAIYILSTTVIMGIVPNAELASSTGPFGLAFAKMFSPGIGQIVMALAVLACLGSLLGWQFTLSQTGKSAADERMFPAFFTKVNKMGAPIVGMIVMGVVQSILALSTISPSLSEQFSALVNLAVVTNVVPYIVALSALMLMMKAGNIPLGKYRLNVAVALVAMLYSVYALYASGKDAVMGGMLVMGVAYIAWGFIAPRFSKKVAAVAAAALLLILAMPASAQRPAAPARRAAPAASTGSATLDRIRQNSRITFGYRTDARPFSFRDGSSGAPDGYTVALCQRVAEAVRTELGLAVLDVQWVPVTVEDRFAAVQAGRVDLLCGADTETMTRRQTVSFSIPVFPAGVGALLRRDAPRRLRDILSDQPSTNPSWRANATQMLQTQVFTVVSGTTAEPWLAGRMSMFRLTATVTPADSYQEGIRRVLDRSANVFFADRAILLDAVARHPSKNQLQLLDRFYTWESNALVLARGDERFRLLVDRTLSRWYATPEFPALYRQWFGEPGRDVLTFFRWNARPE